MTSLVAELGSDWNAAVAKLTAAETHAKQAWAYLTQQAPTALINQVPDLQAEYQTLLSRGNVVASTMSAVKNGVNDAVQSVQNAYGSAVNWVSGLFGVGQVGQLGFVTIISAAVILSAVAAITYWVTGVVAFRQKVDAIQQLVQQGMTPAQAAAAVKSNPGLLQQTANVAKATALLLGVGGVVWLIWRWRGAR